MKIIKIGSQGPDVKKWQYFLIGQDLYFGLVDGDFGELTLDATIKFQKQHNLQPDGIVGNKTVGAAMMLGFATLKDEFTEITSTNFPQKPPFPSLATNSDRQDVFGKFSYKAKPLPGNKENIEILGDWESKNIITVPIPQLINVNGKTQMRFHRLAAQQLKSLWSGWESAGLLHLVLTYEGSFVPRFQRGSKRTLSNHAFGSAFDINYQWNKMGTEPALVGQKGCVRELVEIANDNGFYWGGHFGNGADNKDGMHFEVAFIK